MALAISLIALALSFLVLKGSLNWHREVLAQSYCGNPQTSDGGFTPDNTALWLGDPVKPLLAQIPESNQVLGAADESKWIEVDLSDQTLKAYQGDRLFLETKISSGKFNKTPKGTFRIWGKYKYIKMEGGIKGTKTYYYLPNVPFTMFFYNDEVPRWKGFSLHGTYWHHNFGQPMSHGCVNLPTEISAQLFDWTDPTIPSNKTSATTKDFAEGTKIVIHD